MLQVIILMDFCLEKLGNRKDKPLYYVTQFLVKTKLYFFISSIIIATVILLDISTSKVSIIIAIVLLSVFFEYTLSKAVLLYIKQYPLTKIYAKLTNRKKAFYSFMSVILYLTSFSLLFLSPFIVKIVKEFFIT